MTERFIYYKTGGIIIDDLTGWHYYGNQQVCDLLNQVNRRADKNAEKYWDLKEELHHEQVTNKILKEKLEVWFKVLNKYNIYTAEKLEQVLRNERIW